MTAIGLNGAKDLSHDVAQRSTRRTWRVVESAGLLGYTGTASSRSRARNIFRVFVAVETFNWRSTIMGTIVDHSYNNSINRHSTCSTAACVLLALPCSTTVLAALPGAAAVEHF